MKITLNELKKDNYIDKSIIEKLELHNIKTIELSTAYLELGREEYKTVEDFIAAFTEKNNLEFIHSEKINGLIWDSYTDKNINSYNSAFLGDTFLIKYWNDKTYLAFHIGGDVRGNYTDFIDITENSEEDCFNDESILYQLDTLNINMCFEDKDGKEYDTFNQSSYDVPAFEEIQDLDLDADDLQAIHEQIAY